MEPTVRYTDAELEEFRALILAKIEKSEEDLRILKEQFTNNMDNGTEDTAPMAIPCSGRGSAQWPSPASSGRESSPQPWRT